MKKLILLILLTSCGHVCNDPGVPCVGTEEPINCFELCHDNVNSNPVHEIMKRKCSC